MQQFKCVNWRIRFLMSRTGYLLYFLSITIWLVRKFVKLLDSYFRIWFLDSVSKISINSHYLFRWKMKVFIQWVDVFLPFVWSQKIKKMPKKSVQDPVHHQTKLLKLMEQKEVVSEPHQVSPVELHWFHYFCGVIISINL